MDGRDRELVNRMRQEIGTHCTALHSLRKSALFSFLFSLLMCRAVLWYNGPGWDGIWYDGMGREMLHRDLLMFYSTSTIFYAAINNSPPFLYLLLFIVSSTPCLLFSLFPISPLLSSIFLSCCWKAITFINWSTFIYWMQWRISKRECNWEGVWLSWRIRTYRTASRYVLTCSHRGLNIERHTLEFIAHTNIHTLTRTNTHSHTHIYTLTLTLTLTHPHKYTHIHTVMPSHTHVTRLLNFHV